MSIPANHIFPHATGPALKTVESHKDPQELVFYAGWFCPFVQRVWITLEERGIPYQYKEINPYKKEKHFLDINPKGLVPAFEYQGEALYESLILCEFLEDAYPSQTPKLLPTDPYTRAYCRLWIDHFSKSTIPANLRLIQAQEKEKQDTYLEELYESLRKVANEIKGPWFLGEQFSLVDVVIAPSVVRDFIPTEHRGYKREDVGHCWKEYTDRLQKRESVLNTASDKEHYAEISARYLRNEVQSEAAKATRLGRELP